MSLKDQISEEIRNSMKAGEKVTVSVLRMVNAKILEKEVALRTKKGRDYQLDDDEVVGVLTSYAKQRRQSIESYREAGRDDLAGQEEAELEIIRRFLPSQLSDEDIEIIVDEVISELGAAAPADIGHVMRAVMPRVKGAADGKLVNALVRKKLSTQS
jgi:uncharacterized protein YqeY